MATDLFVAASGLDSAALVERMPPGCRRPIAPPPPPTPDGADVVVALPEWTPRCEALHLLPSFSLLGPREYSFRFELSARIGGEWSPWVGAAALGPASFGPIPASAPALAARVDFFAASAPAERLRLRLRLRAADAGAALDAPWMVALSASDGRPAAAPGPAEADEARLAVPALSQMEEDPAIARRVCSPTSVAMVLAYWQRPAPVAALAGEMFHPALDLYGVWPAAIRAAARRGVAGYLLAFPDWATAAWCLARGLPVIASIRYGAGELSGAAVGETAGHLLVLTGWEGGDVLVNDPAAASGGDVPRRYRREELERVWLERSGVGYVLFPPPPASRAALGSPGPTG